jgi:uncharacterized protein
MSAAQTIFQFKKMLQNLDQCLQKGAAFAEAKKIEADVLAQYRLAPDMFALTKQIQSACDAAKFAAAYLSETTAPKHEDNETTWKQLQERINKVVTYLDGFKAEDFAKAESAIVKPGWAKGQWMHGGAYLAEVSTPNFYFHVTTAYAILRHAGVPVGKMDYLGQVDMQGERQA